MPCRSIRRSSILLLFHVLSQVTAISTQSLQRRSSSGKAIFSRDDSSDSGYDTSNANEQGASGGSDGGIDVATRDQIIIGIVVAVVGLLSISSAALIFIRKKRRWDAIERNHERVQEYYVPPAYRYHRQPLLPRPSYDMESRSTPPPAYPGLPPYDPSTYREQYFTPMGTYNDYAGSRSGHRQNPSLSSHLSFACQPPIPLSSGCTSHARPVPPPRSLARGTTVHFTATTRPASSFSPNRRASRSDPLPMTGFYLMKVIINMHWRMEFTEFSASEEHTYVAIKVCVAGTGKDASNREFQVMKQLGFEGRNSPHIVHMLDQFTLEGPNGVHQCFVLELLGPNVPDIIDSCFSDGRLPGTIAKNIGKQALSGLDSLHRQKIGHGDFHIRNLAFTFPDIGHLPEEEFIRMVGQPELGGINRKDDKSLEPGIPTSVVMPASYRKHSKLLSNKVKIIDFGESILRNTTPETLHTPLPVRPPEVIFMDQLDCRVDLWTMGCMLFELFVGQPPFDSFLITPEILVGQMREMASDELPQRWQAQWETMAQTTTMENSGRNLQEWLEEIYFDGERKEDLTREDIVNLGLFIGKLLWFEPSSRASAREVLGDPLFRD
ncbi:conserved hypothetical protein [Paecilomyces variotii No. 5]|uniref:Protein kinase domain-containing protein n=1 Tax=Byssochlamys spectabilis (strain No. 5 / NBRC 109023) TaxID=1356009 RepID=V5FXZ3_BYSSN|nr:conserved hypothetical protein [Paecilomyces variotii No. 5]